MLVHDNLRKYIAINEGVKQKVYKDSRGIPTVGVGFNLTRGDAAEKLSQVGASYDKVLKGEAVLSFEQIKSLLDLDIAKAIDDAARTFQNFHQISPDRQVVLVDMAFNLGPNRLRRFRKMIKAVESEDWETAAKEMRESRWFKQVGRRGRRNVSSFRHGTLAQH